MIFEVNREEFIRAIRPSVEVATKNTLKDFKYNNLLTIEALQDKIVISAYGGTASLLSPISDSNFGSLDYKCEEEGKTTVRADDLLTFTQSLPNSYDHLKISLESNQLKISSSLNKPGGKKKFNSVRTMPVISETVHLPNTGKKFEQEVEVDREIFVKGMESVIFAPAFEEKMYSYMCMLFEAISDKDQELRFSAGSGGRFAVKSIKGKNIISNAQEAKIIFPKDCLGAVSKLLAEASQPFVIIKSIEADQKNNIPEHIMIEFDEMVLCIYGLEHFTKYPDLTKIINHKYPNRIYSNLEDWVPVIKTIEGTLHGYSENIHNTKVVLEEENEIFEVTPQTTHTSPTFIDMVDVGDCVIKGEKIWFCSNSDYIREMVVQGGKRGRVQLNFESQSILEDIPDDKPKQMKPILVKFSEDIDSVKDVISNFYMFFTVSTK